MKKIKAHLQDQNDLKRTLIRISHEIIEKNPDLSQTAIVGIRTRGEIIAHRIAESIGSIAGLKIDNGTIDVTFYRDDFKTNFDSPKVGPSEINFDVSGKNIILIDDVLYTGRTIRAAMDEVFSYGRPASIQLGVLVDRGHRELPIKTDFVGKNYPTSINEHIHVHIKEIDGKDEVLLMEYVD
tara:strand:- start:100 stop:645 length:546 start_codon:yes stop_codon:yes gene_type:complete